MISHHPVHTPTLHAIAVLILCATPFDLGAADATFAVDAPSRSTLSIDVREVREPVNRRVMGLCLLWPPFDQAMRTAFDGVLDDTSGRTWLGDTKQMPMYGPFYRDMGMREMFAFHPVCHINRIATYTSADSNNLDPHQQPDAVADLVEAVWDQQPIDVAGKRTLCWEIWNEPQFPQNGAWPADDFARYALDVSRAIARRCPEVEIAVPLHEDDDEWNRRMLSRIAAADPAAIDVAVTHPYSFGWIRQARTIGPYWSRALAAESIRERKLQPKLDAVMAIGHGRWRLVASEWNTHPEGYGPPYSVSTDMAAAIHVAAMFGTFWDLGVDAAQFFELRGKDDTHFHLVVPGAEGEGLRWNPTGSVFRLYGTYFRGDRLDATLSAPTVALPGDGDRPPRQVPLVLAQSAYDHEHRRLVVMLVNRHRDQPAPLDLRIANFRPTSASARLHAVSTGDGGDPVRVRDDELRLPIGDDPELTLALPPASVQALIINGVLPPSEDELFSQRVRFITRWRVGSIADPQPGPAHGLDRELPTDDGPGTELDASRSGFVNVASLLDPSGRSQDLREDFQAVASTWVFSPVARRARLSLGFDYWGEVRINGASCLRIEDNQGPARADRFRTVIDLAPGWNQLTVRVASGSKGMGFWCGIERTGDLQFSTDAGRPDWPRTWSVSADQGCTVNSLADLREVPDHDAEVLELSATPNRRRAYLAWPELAIPAEIAIAEVRFEATPMYSKGEGVVTIRPVSGPWKEASTTDAAQPELAPALAVTCDQQAPAWTFAGEELTALVTTWRDDHRRAFGIALESTTEGYCGFASDDSTTAAPRLVFERR